jgi:hypothetical protein
VGEAVVTSGKTLGRTAALVHPGTHRSRRPARPHSPPAAGVLGAAKLPPKLRPNTVAGVIENRAKLIRWRHIHVPAVFERLRRMTGNFAPAMIDSAVLLPVKPKADLSTGAGIPLKVE